MCAQVLRNPRRTAHSVIKIDGKREVAENDTRNW
jgi:hypothetical protein